MEYCRTSLCLIVMTVCLHITMATRTSYKAAVYEHVIISADDATGNFTREEAFEWMSKNLDVFEKQIAVAAKQGVDIIVFPEYGVTGFDHTRDSMVPFLEDIPDPELNWHPCNDPDRFPDTKILHRLSCMAKKYTMYVVANIGDIKTCDHSDSSCPGDGRYQLNTNVVFDAKGKLTARYHKLNLYDESDIFDPAPTPEYVTFDTPFGLFGTVVCFDLMHYYPTQVLLSDNKVKNLLVTSAWNVFYPFVISTQMYSGISKINRVNVIASNARSDIYLMAGSGMFGAGVSVLSDPDYESDNGVLLITQLNSRAYEDTDPGVKALDPIYKDIAHIQLPNLIYHGNYEYGMNMSFAVLSKNKTGTAVCDEIVCCAVEYQYDFNAPDEEFIVGASDFSMDYPGKVHLQLCAVHRCQTRDLASCGLSVALARSTFKYIKLQAFFSKDLVFPIVSTSPFNNITISTEKDNYFFDQDHAVIESNSLKHPLHAMVLLNSVTEIRYKHATHTNTIPKTGGSRNGLPVTNASLSLHIACILMLVNIVRFLTGQE